MDAAEALADLTGITSQIERAAIFDEAGVRASTLAVEDAAELARLGRELITAGDRVRRREASGGLAELHVETARGSVFVVRHAGRTIVATTPARPPAGLVRYDLRRCLQSIENDDAAPRGPRKKTRAAG